jgi:hypothetical protein
MKKFLLGLSILVFGCFECTEVNTVCSDIRDNDQAPGWFKELKNDLTNCTCEISIVRATYQHQTVFYTALTDPMCNGVNTPTLLNCDGEIIKTFTLSEADQKDFFENVIDKNILYRCKN